MKTLVYVHIQKTFLKTLTFFYVRFFLIFDQGGPKRVPKRFLKRFLRVFHDSFLHNFFGKFGILLFVKKTFKAVTLVITLG